MSLDPPRQPDPFGERRRPSPWRAVLPGLLVALACALVAVWVVDGAGGLVGTGRLDGVRAAGRSHPPLPADVSPRPLGRPQPAPAGNGGYAVLQSQPGSGEPVGWDPCRPLRYVVNRAHVPATGDHLLAGAVAELQAVTGILFVDEGTVDEAPADDRAPVQREVYGDRWAPVLIAWSDPVSSPGLAGPIAGYAGPQVVEGAEPDTLRYVTGQVVLDGPQLEELANGPAGLARARGVLLHELGHLIGLDHVDDPDQLMYPSTTLLGVEFAAGDLRGLAAVSGQPCRTDW